MGLLDIFRRHPNTVNEPFVDSPMRDNWYQASSYFPSPFALITTVSEDGETNIGPYQLTFPFEVIKGRSFMLCSRQNSNTDHNLKRTKKCSLNYIEFDKRNIKKIVNMGYPGQTTEEKMKDNPYTLIDSPTEGRAADGKIYPHILKEAFQVYECTVDVAQPTRDDGNTPEYFVLPTPLADDPPETDARPLAPTPPLAKAPSVVDVGAEFEVLLSQVSPPSPPSDPPPAPSAPIDT